MCVYAEMTPRSGIFIHVQGEMRLLYAILLIPIIQIQITKYLIWIQYQFRWINFLLCQTLNIHLTFDFLNLIDYR